VWVHGAGDQHALFETVEDVGQRRPLVSEIVHELADGLASVPVKLREHVRLGLGDAEPFGGPLEVNGNEVDGAFEICNHYDMGYYQMGRSDEELLRRFEGGELAADEFPHECHVRVAWLLSRCDEPAVAFERLADGIRAIARGAGRPQRFHLTVTRAWFELIAAVDDLEAHPELLDRGLLGRYYSDGALNAGRERWVEPDRNPLVLPPPELPAVIGLRVT
jgi:hypothetical protein